MKNLTLQTKGPGAAVVSQIRQLVTVIFYDPDDWGEEPMMSLGNKYVYLQALAFFMSFVYFQFDQFSIPETYSF